jgi:hypothetical protein
MILGSKAQATYNKLCGHFAMTALRVLPGVTHESYEKLSIHF